MFSMADGWNFTIRSIAKQQRDGESSVKSALDELKAMGYISYNKHQDGTGTYYLDDDPKHENPNVENPNLGKPQRIKNKQLVKNKNCSELKTTEKEKQSDIFAQFWIAYPKKKSKEAARKAFLKKLDRMPDINEVIQKLGMLSLTEQWTKDNGKFIPHAATWLNDHGWEDEVVLSDYDKAKAIAKAKGITMSEFYQEMHGA